MAVTSLIFEIERRSNRQNVGNWTGYPNYIPVSHLDKQILVSAQSPIVCDVSIFDVHCNSIFAKSAILDHVFQSSNVSFFLYLLSKHQLYCFFFVGVLYKVWYFVNGNAEYL